MTSALFHAYNFYLPTYQWILHMCHLQGDKYADPDHDSMDFLKERHYTAKKNQAYALAV
jgi:hypothetical protein